MFLLAQMLSNVIGMWLQKILTDMKNKVNPSGNQTLEDMKLFLYSAVSMSYNNVVELSLQDKMKVLPIQ